MIHAVTEAAAAGGVRPGMRLTDARALDPTLLAEPADPTGDAALLKRLARWAGRWSPLVEVDPSTARGTGGEDGLRLDVSGVAHLFGGEERLAADMERSFAGLGLTARIAIAPTAAAAWALARYAPPPWGEVSSRSGDGGGLRAFVPFPPPACGWHPPAGGELFAALAPLPVAALRLEARSVQILERLGLKTIGQLARVSRKSLQRRFREADNPLHALDRALGRRPEPLTAAPYAPSPRALARLAEPATHPEAAGQALERLVPDLARQLAQRRLGVRRLHLAGYRVDGSIAGSGVATAIPSRDPAHLHRLLKDKAAALDPGFGFDAFALTAEWTEELGAAQDSLVEEPSGTGELARLVDRLTVKFGSDAVRRPKAQESHLPERASGWVAAIGSSLPAKLAGRGTMRSMVEGFRTVRPSPSTALRAVLLPQRAGGGLDRRNPPARPLGDMALLALRPPHALGTQLDGQPVDQPCQLALARRLLDQAVLCPAKLLRPLRLQREGVEAEFGVQGRRLVDEQPPKVLGLTARDRRRDRRHGEASVDAVAGQHQPPRAKMPLLQLPDERRDQAIERLGRRFRVGRRLLQLEKHAGRPVGGDRGQRLRLAAERAIERIHGIVRLAKASREAAPLDSGQHGDCLQAEPLERPHRFGRQPQGRDGKVG